MAIAVKRSRAGALRGATEFETFYSSGFPTVYRAALAFSNSPDIATEATQEAFVRAFARWRRLKGHEWALGWVMTTAFNVVRKHRKERLPTVLRHALAPQDPNTRVIDRVDLVAKLVSLPPRQRQAVVLHYIGGFQLSEVAHLMNVSVGAVKSHLFKARVALRAEEPREEHHER